MNATSPRHRPIWKRFRFRIGTAMVLFGFLLASCSPPAPEKIVIRGSNTFGEELAPRLVAEYKKDHPTIVFDLEFKGSSYGMGGLLWERCDIGASSRELAKFEPEVAKERGLEFVDHVIGSYSVAVIVHTSSPVAELTREQVRDVFTGTIQNWKDVGGPDAPIHLYIRDQVSGTHLGFQELAMDRKPYATSVKPFTNHSAIVRAVAEDANGIGYVSIDQTRKPGVKGVSIGGVPPTAATVNQGKYPYARVLRLLTVKPNEPPAAKAFIDFVLSPRGQQIVEQMGYVPKQ